MSSLGVISFLLMSICHSAAVGRRMIEHAEPRVLNVSDVAEIGYREVLPHPVLAPFVECLWVAGRSETRTDDDRRILPDGRMDLIWIRGTGVLVAGPQSRFTARPDVTPLVAVGVRFHPGVAPGLLRAPAADFVDGHVPLAAVDAQLAGRIEATLDASWTLAGAFETLNRELLRHVDRLAELDATVCEAASMLNHASATVADVSSRVFLSERQLRRRFTERVGYGPKTLQRVLRFQRLVSILDEPEASLARAAAVGYADQAHLTRECRDLSGLTPGILAEWLHRRALRRRS
jgi:AraC-like DNA-binding protein